MADKMKAGYVPHTPYAEVCDIHAIIYGLIDDATDELDCTIESVGDLDADGHAHVFRLHATDGSETFTITIT